MRYLVSAEEMKAIDRRSINEYGIPSLVLMERAALAVANEAERLFEERSNLRPSGKKDRGNVWAVCGYGNNGADGVAAGRMLFLHGFQVTILLPGTDGRRSEELKLQLEIARKLGIPICTAEDFIPGTCDLILDAVFGIGLSREVEGAYRDLIGLIKDQEQAVVVSVDMPSGVSSDTGKVMGTSVRADVTVTFGEKKIGQVLFPGRELCGRLIVADIGFVPEEKEKAEIHMLSHDRRDLKRIPERQAYSHKGTYGKVLIFAGSKNMAGAAYFSALAAYRMGAGLVKTVTVEENRTILMERLPEAILSTYDREWAGQFPEDFKAYIREQTAWADAIILGPGIGREEYAKNMVEAVLSSAYVPIIMDADAINLAARYPYLKGYFTENIILTPHLAEFSRLTDRPVDEIREDLPGAARSFSDQYGVTCILKDAATVTARKDGRIFINESGSPALAKGGSGDVLTGVIAGLLALGLDDCEAASLGVYIHGLAGEEAAMRYGVHSVLAKETADCLGEVIRK